MAIQRKPRQIRQEETHNAILAAAEQLLIEYGRTAFSLRKVAAASDYSPAGLYEYFDSKDALIDGVRKQIRVRFHTHLTSTRRGTQDSILEIAKSYLAFANQNRAAFLLVFGESGSTGAQEKTAPSMVFLTALTQIFPTVSSRKIATEAYVIWAAVHGIAMLNVTEFQHLSDEKDGLTTQMLQMHVNPVISRLSRDANSRLSEIRATA